MDPGIHSLPYSAAALITWAFGDYLELGCFRHSSECYTVSILDTDNNYLTFRLNRSLIPHWTLVPVAGFVYHDGLKL